MYRERGKCIYTYTEREGGRRGEEVPREGLIDFIREDEKRRQEEKMKFSHHLLYGISRPPRRAAVLASLLLCTHACMHAIVSYHDFSISFAFAREDG